MLVLWGDTILLTILSDSLLPDALACLEEALGILSDSLEAEALSCFDGWDLAEDFDLAVATDLIAV